MSIPPGMMELQFKKGALVIVNINTDKEGSREIFEWLIIIDYSQYAKWFLLPLGVV